MGGAEIFFEITAYLIVAAVVGLGLAAFISNVNKSKPAILRPCSDVVGLNVPIVIGETPGVKDCVHNGQTGSYYYLGQAEGATGDFVVANFQTPPQDVCRKYCINPNLDSCTGPSIGGVSSQVLYNNCVQQLITDYEGNCIPPAPMAIKGIQPFFPYSPTSNFCENTM